MNFGYFKDKFLSKSHIQNIGFSKCIFINITKNHLFTKPHRTAKLNVL
jgi:hypothetical protein